MQPNARPNKQLAPEMAVFGAFRRGKESGEEVSEYRLTY